MKKKNLQLKKKKKKKTNIFDKNIKNKESIEENYFYSNNEKEKNKNSISKENNFIESSILEKNQLINQNDNLSEIIINEDNVYNNDSLLKNNDLISEISQNIFLINEKYKINENEKLFHIYDPDNLHLMITPISSPELFEYILQKKINIYKAKFKLIDIFCFNNSPYSFQNLNILYDKDWVNKINKNPIASKILQFSYNKQKNFNEDISEINNNMSFSLDILKKENIQNELNYKKHNDESEDLVELLRPKKNNIKNNQSNKNCTVFQNLYYFEGERKKSKK